jgi:SAM-dependent methyltransferase
MKYSEGFSDKIPYASGYFDIVTSFNSLDHVDNIERTVAEITRVTKSGGTFLLIVEINHRPTPTEPLSLSREMLLGSFSSGFTVERCWRCALIPGRHDIYGSVLAGQPPASETEPAVLCASLARNAERWAPGSW